MERVVSDWMILGAKWWKFLLEEQKIQRVIVLMKVSEEYSPCL